MKKKLFYFLLKLTMRSDYTAHKSGKVNLLLRKKMAINFYLYCRKENQGIRKSFFVLYFYIVELAENRREIVVKLPVTFRPPFFYLK